MDDPAGNGSGSTSGPSWRVGVHLPVKVDEDIAAHAAMMAADTHLTTQVRQRCAGRQTRKHICKPYLQTIDMTTAVFAVQCQT
jgi:hypothetical protein